MKSNLKVSLGVAVLSIAATSSMFAKNITINDTQNPNSAGWGGGPNVFRGQGNEDNETEPGTIANQGWDLEAFTLNGSSLKVYSGYNLLAGNTPYGLGDLFIGRGNVAKYQAGSYTGADSAIAGTLLNSQFSYDYVIHFNSRSGTSIGTGTYDVYKVGAGAKFDVSTFKGLSNPYKLQDSSPDAVLVGSGTMSVVVNATASLTLEDGTTVTGGTHYIGAIDLAASGVKLSSTDDNLFHLTMQCGNDNLIGRVPDGGMTLVLLGSSLAGLTFLSRRFGRAS